MRTVAFLGWLVGVCALGASACGSTLDVGNGSTADGGTGAGDPAVCDEYASTCRSESDKQAARQDCVSRTSDATCGSRASAVFRCFLAKGGSCGAGVAVDPDDVPCASERTAYETCAKPDECTTNAECAGTPTPVCLVSKPSKPNTCVACIEDADCTGSGSPRCSDDHRCPVQLPKPTEP